MNYKEIPYSREAMRMYMSTPGVRVKQSKESIRPGVPRYIYANGYIACDVTYSDESLSAYILKPTSSSLILLPLLEKWVPFDKIEEIPFGRLATIISNGSVAVITGYVNGFIYFNASCMISRSFADAFHNLVLVEQNEDGTIKTDENGKWVTQPFGKKVEVAS